MSRVSHEIVQGNSARCRCSAFRVVLFSAAAYCHYCHGVRLKCHRGSDSFIQCKLLVYTVWCSCVWWVPCVWCAIARGVMSVAGGNAPAEDKKIGYCEDSTDSDNDTERKQLLRRISTSKCVGRLVSGPAVMHACCYTLQGWACQVSNASRRGGRTCARAAPILQDQFSSYNVCLARTLNFVC